MPVPINTRLGWVLLGPVQTSNVTNVNFTCSHILRLDSPTGAVERELQAFWELESFGIREKEDPVQKQFTESVQMVNGKH